MMGLENYEAMINLFSAESAIKKPNTVEQVAAVAVLMASNAGRNMTACMFPVDGGSLPY
jgi:3-hydroxybutyrate dehydrogenase